MIELSQGFNGAIPRNEGLFYGLDSLALFVAVVVYVPFWPGRFIGRVFSRYDTVHNPGGEGFVMDPRPYRC